MAAFLQRLLEALGAGQAVRLHLLALVAHDEVDDVALGKSEHLADAGHDHMLDGRVRDHFLQHVREVLEDDDDGGAGVGELMLELARGVQRVGIDDGETGAQRAVHGDRVLQGVRHHDGDAIALLEAAAVLQERAELHRQDVELAEGHGLAHLHVRIAHGVDGEPALDELLERGVLIDVDLRRERPADTT